MPHCKSCCDDVSYARVVESIESWIAVLGSRLDVGCICHPTPQYIHHTNRYSASGLMLLEIDLDFDDLIVLEHSRCS